MRSANEAREAAVSAAPEAVRAFPSAPGPPVASQGSDGPVRWGILSTGKIALDWARAMAADEARRTSEVVAVASQSGGEESARRFCAEAGLDPARVACYGAYDDLLCDPNVEAVYAAGLSSSHAEQVKSALEAMKHVLVEKPIALHASDVRMLFGMARDRRLFCQEAMWTRCFPATHKVRELLGDGVIGRVRHMRCDLGFRVFAKGDARGDADSRLLDPAKGGGCLFDIGVYTIQAALLAHGGRHASVEDIGACGAVHKDTGVDIGASAVLRFPGGGTASISFSFESNYPGDCVIHGERGTITIQGPFHCPTSVTVCLDPTAPGEEATVERYDFPLPLIPGNPVMNYCMGRTAGLAYEIAEAARCIRKGSREIPWWTQPETLEAYAVMEAIFSGLGGIARPPKVFQERLPASESHGPAAP